MDSSFSYQFDNASHKGTINILMTHNLRRMIIEIRGSKGELESRERYFDGYLHGSQEEFDEDGRLIYKASYNRGLLSGKLEVWSASGLNNSVKWFWNDREVSEEEYSELVSKSPEYEMIQGCAFLKTPVSEDKVDLPTFPISYPIKTWIDKVYEKYTFTDQNHLTLELFYMDGKPQMTLNYSYGKLEGPYETHFPNGKLEERGFYCRGLLHGKREIYAKKHHIFSRPRILWYWLGRIVSPQQFKINSEREKNMLNNIKPIDNGFERFQRQDPTRSIRRKIFGEYL